MQSSFLVCKTMERPKIELIFVASSLQEKKHGIYVIHLMLRKR